jgi:hypothetical protein
MMELSYVVTGFRRVSNALASWPGSSSAGWVKPCRTSLEMFSTLYDFCRDQGSIIGGLLALAAGYLVFRGTTRTADRQVAAANAQTEALRDRHPRQPVTAMDMTGGANA